MAVAALRDMQEQLAAARARAAGLDQELADERSRHKLQAQELRLTVTSSRNEVDQLRQLVLELKDGLGHSIKVRTHSSTQQHKSHQI